MKFISVDNPEGFIPDHVQCGSSEIKRTWLHNAVAQVVDRFVKFDDIEDVAAGVLAASKKRPLQGTDFPCRHSGCPVIFKYSKARENHENKVHGLHLPLLTTTVKNSPKLKDHVKQHTEARLSFGLFLMDMQDAVREGDGERLLRLYTIALLFYKAYGHHQYAYSTFLLTVQVNATLSPALAHSVIWNRFWNGRGGKGKNISLDLHLEHLNNFLKSFLKRSGPNMSEQAADRVSKSLYILKEMMDTTDRELEVSKSSGVHHTINMTEDISCLVDVFTKARLFNTVIGREFSTFPKFRRDLFSKVRHAELWGWMRSKLLEWRTLPL